MTAGTLGIQRNAELRIVNTHIVQTAKGIEAARHRQIATETETETGDIAGETKTTIEIMPIGPSLVTSAAGMNLPVQTGAIGENLIQGPGVVLPAEIALPAVTTANVTATGPSLHLGPDHIAHAEMRQLDDPGTKTNHLVRVCLRWN